MKLSFKEYNWNLSNDPTELLDILEQLKQMHASLNEYYSHMVIDELEVFEPFDDYLIKHGANIGEVQVISKQYRQLVNEILISLRDFLYRALPEMERISDSLYQGGDISSKIEQLLDAIAWIFQAMSSISKNYEENQYQQEFTLLSADINIKLPMLLEAMQSGDKTLMGDVIHYELIPIFQNVSAAVNHALNNEVN